MSAIPASSRLLVRGRSQERCQRCGAFTVPGHWHHRRRRGVRDEHTHHPCNGAWLCGACHAWVHAHPFEAALEGFLISQYEPEPGALMMHTPWGWVLLACDGTYRTLEVIA